MSNHNHDDKYADKSLYALVGLKSITFSYDNIQNIINIYLWVNDVTVFTIVLSTEKIRYRVSNDGGQTWHLYWEK